MKNRELEDREEKQRCKRLERIFWLLSELQQKQLLATATTMAQAVAEAGVE